MQVFNVIPREIVDSYDPLMQKNSFYINADFPDLNLTNCKIDIIIGFGIDTLNNLKKAWKANIGKTISVKLETSSNRTFTLYPQ